MDRGQCKVAFPSFAGVENLADMVGRHDIDRNLPRTPKEIFNLNRMMVDKMREAFGKDVVIVPSIGNNDIYPHNVLAPGPNTITSEFLQSVGVYNSWLQLIPYSIWKHFIPEDYRHVFERGAHFSVEVVPDRLAVISLNTLFWYDSNTRKLMLALTSASS